MGVLSVQNEAIQGIQRGLDGLRRNAQEIASADQLNNAGQETDLAGALLGLQENKTQVQASAKVVSAVDEMIGSIIDLRV